MASLLTLTTDFGLTDWFAGTLKGVVLARAPDTRIVDISHGIAPGDSRGGAFALAASCAYFPEGTVHLAVVDPGVGGSRAALAVRTKRFLFVGPDNGVLSFALRNETVESARYLRNEELFLSSVSRTFHGRDVFAPVAAYLCGGGEIEKVGPEAREWVRLRWPEPLPAGRGQWRGEVVYVDRYGNAITNLPETLLPEGGENSAAVMALEGGREVPVKAFYGAVERGVPVAVPGSSGLIELAVNAGHAGDSLDLFIGSPVWLRDDST